jgi:hypothetical protein
MIPRTLFTPEQETLRLDVRNHLLGEVVPEYPSWAVEGRP